MAHAERHATLMDDDLRLRPVRIPEDVAQAVPWYHDPEVLRFSEGEGVSPYDAAMVERMFRDMTSRCDVYVIEVQLPHGWHAIGDAALCATAGTPITIGDGAYRSRGLGKRVLALLVARARTRGWARMVVSGIYTDNERALRLYRRAGFSITGQTGEESGRPMWTMELDLA
jgi:RimJ/RimL family protein N-acetyltransferase